MQLDKTGGIDRKYDEKWIIGDIAFCVVFTLEARHPYFLAIGHTKVWYFVLHASDESSEHGWLSYKLAGASAVSNSRYVQSPYLS